MYIRKIMEDFKKEIGSSTLIVGDFNTPLSTMERSCKQNISKTIVSLNNALDQIDFTDTYRTFIPTKQNIHSFQMHMEYF